MQLRLSQSVADIGNKFTPIISDLANCGVLKTQEGRDDTMMAFLILAASTLLAARVGDTYIRGDDKKAASLCAKLAEHLLASAESWLERN